MWSSAATWRAKSLPGKVQREGRSEESEKLRPKALIRNIGSSTAGLGSGPCTPAIWAFFVNLALRRPTSSGAGFARSTGGAREGSVNPRGRGTTLSELCGKLVLSRQERRREITPQTSPSSARRTGPRALAVFPTRSLFVRELLFFFTSISFLGCPNLRTADHQILPRRKSTFSSSSRLMQVPTPHRRFDVFRLGSRFRRSLR
jgi:hypothetical protein